MLRKKQGEKVTDGQVDEGEGRRHVLLEQLAYLLHEVEALQQVIKRVPGNLLEQPPPASSFSIKQRFGLLAMRDEEVHQRWLEQIVAEEEPHFEQVDEQALVEKESWNERSMDDILDRVQQARDRLVKAFKKLPASEWERGGLFGEKRRDVYALARDIARNDVTHLRMMGQLLYQSDMTGPPDDAKQG